MFTELLPVLKDRIVTITIARLDESLLRVNVLPKRRSDKETDAAEGLLSVPLTVTATAEELDREFAEQVLSFSGSYERAACNIREIEKAHAAAVKAAEDEQKNARGKKPSTTGAARAATQAQGDSTLPANGKPVFGNKALCPPATASQSLFDSQPADPPERPETTEPAKDPQPEPARGAPLPAAAVTATTGTADSASVEPK